MLSPPDSLSLSLPTQLVKADDRPPRARFCSRCLPVKGEFFLAAVIKCLLVGQCWVSVYCTEYGLYLLYMKSALR